MPKDFTVAQTVFAPWDDPNEKPLIQFKNVTKRFGEFIAIDDLTQDIYSKEFFALLGPSGCGKTTMMRILAGFETPTEGQILISGQDMSHVPPNKRAVNMMFQSYALFPHLSVWDNIAFGLKREGKDKDTIAARVEEMLRLTRLDRFAKRKPHQISGGQRQRVAHARSLAQAPKLLLLDEPLGALDKKLRQDTQFELMDIQEKTGTTFVIVTHDQEEAMTVASRVAVMDEGKIVQVATPDEIYEAPNSIYVADFIGDVNLIEGRAEARMSPATPRDQIEPTTTPDPEGAPPPPAKPDAPQPNAYGEWLQNTLLFPFLGKRAPNPKELPAPSETKPTPALQSPVKTGGIALHWADGHPPIVVANGDPQLAGAAVTLALRPEKLNIAKNKPDTPNALPGTVIDIGYLGNLSTYHVQLDNGPMVKVQVTNVRRIARRDITWEDAVWVSFSETSGVVLKG